MTKTQKTQAEFVFSVFCTQELCTELDMKLFYLLLWKDQPVFIIRQAYLHAICYITKMLVTQKGQTK